MTVATTATERANERADILKCFWFVFYAVALSDWKIDSDRIALQSREKQVRKGDLTLLDLWCIEKSERVDYDDEWIQG